MRGRGTLFLVAVMLAGCNKAGAPSPAPAAEKPAAAPTATLVAKSERAAQMAAAMSAPKGGSPSTNALIEGAQRALEKNPQKTDWWIVLSRGWVRKARESSDPGYHVNAKAAADLALAIEPGNRVALGLNGIVLLAEHRFDDAKTLAERILATDADDPHAYGLLSDACLELGRVEEATAAAEKMVELKPNLPSYSRVSYLQWLRGDVRAARESARLAIDSGRDRRDPEPVAWVIVHAATMFWHEGDLAGADAGFDKALDWVPAYPPALVGKARVALARGDAKRAATLAAQALEQSPLPETAWLLGDAHAALGDGPATEAAYRRVEELGARTDPRTLARFLATKGRDAERAVALAEREAAKRGDVATLDAKAWALHRAGRTAEARATIERARRFGTAEPELLYHHGAIALAAGDASGRRLVAAALAKNGAFDPTGAAEARALLAAGAASTKVAAR